MSSRDKIYVSKDKAIEDLYAKLKEESDETPSKPFRTMKDIFLAAAVMGYINNEFKELSSAKDLFMWSTLINDNHALPVLQSIALVKTNDPSILLNDDEVAKIAEGYANGGIHILAKKILETDTEELNEAAIYMMEVLKNNIISENEAAV